MFLSVLLLLPAAILGELVDIYKHPDLVLGPDDLIEFSLKSNPSTGYSWTLVPQPDTTLEFNSLNGKYVPDTSGLIGASGHQYFTISCSEYCVAGTIESISLFYERPSEIEVADALSLEISIVE